MKNRTDCPAFFMQRTCGSNSNGFYKRLEVKEDKEKALSIPEV